MAEWTYTGDTRINFAMRTEDGLLNAVVWFDGTQWNWNIRRIKNADVSTLGAGMARSARLCIEAVHAFMGA